MEDETRLILLASEQVIPNVASALHYWKRGGLAAIHILYTDDDRRSRGPADRLNKLFDELRAVAPFDNRAPTTVRLDDQPVGIVTQAVRERIAELITTAPAARWVVNVTGGLKMMAFGGMGLPEPRPRIVYLERGQGWFTLETNAGGAVTARRDPDLPTDGGALLDDIPIASIVRTQFIDADRFTFSDKGKPAAMDVAEFVRNGIANRWDWRKLANPGEQSGFAFERLIGSAVLRMGIENIAWSLKIGEGHELDLVLCKGGVISLLDLKLMPREGKERPHAQIREAADAGIGIGGVDRRVIMLRPNWEPNEEMAALARARNVILITQEQAGTVFSTLARLVGGTPDDNLLEADRLLSESQAALGFALAIASPGHEVLPRRGESGMIKMEDVFQLFCERERQNWMLVDHGAHLEFWIREAGSGSDWASLVNRNPLFLGLECVLMSRTGFLTWGDEQLRAGDRSAIARALQRARGKVISFSSFKRWCEAISV